MKILIKKINFSFFKIAKFILLLILFSFAFQPGIVIYQSSFISGIFNGFTIFQLFLFDCLFVLLLFSLVLAFCFEKKNDELNDFFADFKLRVGDGLINFLLVSILLVMSVSVFFAAEKNLALLNLIRWIELYALLIILFNGLVSKELILKYLLSGLFLQALIVLAQFKMQSSLNLGWLGEPDLNREMLNVAKIDVGSEKMLRPYGTFLHPNILGASAVFSLGLLLVLSIYKKVRWYYYLPFLMLLIFSFSRSAWLAAIVLLLALIVVGEFKLNWKMVLAGLFTLILFVIFSGVLSLILSRVMTYNGSALTERAELFDIALKMFRADYWTGVGLGNFVFEMKNFVGPAWEQWMFQPVHNLFVLILVETGFFGLFFWVSLILVLIKICFYAKNKFKQKEMKILFSTLISFIVLSMFDHYFITNISGQLMLIFLIYLIAEHEFNFQELSDSR